LLKRVSVSALVRFSVSAAVTNTRLLGRAFHV
jgi:hypothetical protein